MTHALVAVSPGFRSSAYLHRKLRDAFRVAPESIVVVAERILELPSFLSGLFPDSSITWREAATIGRPQAQEAVANVDVVLIFWDGESLSSLIFEARRNNKLLDVVPVEVTKVVNRNTDAFDAYIGRGSPWGNPFKVGEGPDKHTRKEAIELFREHFNSELLPNTGIRSRLIALRGQRLGCYCKPLACHGDVIADYLNALDPEHLQAGPQGGAMPSTPSKEIEAAIPDRPSAPTHLFISYAIEDAALAKWLARKLAAHGYAVWFDQLRLLGGEPWPQSIDLAIKQRTFRMLALMSTSSVAKANPSKERTLALAIGRQRQISDFLITLKVDSVSLDWLTSDISYISFQKSWADGLRQLLKKLRSIAAPQILSNPLALVNQSITTEPTLVQERSEELRANVIKVTKIPLALRGFKLPEQLSEEEMANLRDSWPFYTVRPGYAVAFDAPRAGSSSVVATREQWSWNDVQRIHGVIPRNIVSNLIVRTVHTRLVRNGLLTHPSQRGIYYLPENFAKDGLLRFVDYKQKKTWLKVRGKASFVRPGKPRETNYHHFAFKLFVGRGLDANFWVEIVPTLFFFDSDGIPIVDARVGSRRRRLTRNWWNNKWLNRLLATENVLLQFEDPESSVSLKEGLIRLTSPVSISEEALAPLNAVEDSDADVVVEVPQRDDVEEGELEREYADQQ